MHSYLPICIPAAHGLAAAPQHNDTRTAIPAAAVYLLVTP